MGWGGVEPVGGVWASAALGPPPLTAPPTSSPPRAGFVPQTIDEDGQALDVLVIMSESVHPFSFLRAIPVAVVAMTAGGRPDSKIIAVHADDPAYRDFKDVHDLPPHRLKEISRFLEVGRRDRRREDGASLKGDRARPRPQTRTTPRPPFSLPGLPRVRGARHGPHDPQSVGRRLRGRDRGQAPPQRGGRRVPRGVPAQAPAHGVIKGE